MKLVELSDTVRMWQEETAHSAAEEAEAAGQLAGQVRYVLLQRHRRVHVQVPVSAYVATFCCRASHSPLTFQAIFPDTYSLDMVSFAVQGLALRGAISQLTGVCSAFSSLEVILLSARRERRWARWWS